MKYLELANRRNEVIKKVGMRLFKFARINYTQRDVIANRSKFKKVANQKELIANYKLANSIWHDILAIKSVRHRNRNVENTTLKQRLTLFKSKRITEKQIEIKECIESCIRTDNEIFLNFECTENSVGTEDFLNWNYYAKSCKYPKKQVNQTFNFKMSLNEIYSHIGLLFADDIFIMPDFLSDNVASGKQVSNGRGYSLKMSNKEVFVVIKSGYTGHGNTLNRAMNIIDKKEGIDARIKNSARQSVCNLFKNRNVKLTREDSKSAGNCRAGTESFIARMELRGTYITIRKAWLLYKRTKNNDLKRVIERKLNLTLSK